MQNATLFGLLVRFQWTLSPRAILSSPTLHRAGADKPLLPHSPPGKVHGFARLLTAAADTHRREQREATWGLTRGTELPERH